LREITSLNACGEKQHLDGLRLPRMWTEGLRMFNTTGRPRSPCFARRVYVRSRRSVQRANAGIEGKYRYLRLQIGRRPSYSLRVAARLFKSAVVSDRRTRRVKQGTEYCDARPDLVVGTQGRFLVTTDIAALCVELRESVSADQSGSGKWQLTTHPLNCIRAYTSQTRFDPRMVRCSMRTS